MQQGINILRSVREYMVPVLTVSGFHERGVLTPEEFVIAGNQLVFSCPTWAWSAAEAGHGKDYLPTDKQYLITRNVPSLRRAHSMLDTFVEFTPNVNDHEDGDWDTSFSLNFKNEPKSITELTLPEEKPLIFTLPVPTTHHSLSDPNNVPDLESFEEDNVDEESQHPIIKAEEPLDTIIHTRTYDLSITYDKYYQTPRVWLFGYEVNHQPLNSEQIMEDISNDHAYKTVTVDPHPHTGVSHASIHPCRHAETMKRLVEMMKENGKEVRTEHYLFLFLKFISSVIPTIDYDYTLSF